MASQISVAELEKPGRLIVLQTSESHKFVQMSYAMNLTYQIVKENHELY